MVNIHLSYTSLINPPNATPVLTIPQIWEGLQRKIRFAQEFVPVIESCDVVEDKDNVVTRDVKFKPGAGPKEQAREVVRSFEPSWVDFEQEDGTHIRNVVSYGSDMSEESLHMTYMFQFVIPHAEAGTEAAEKEFKRLQGMAKVAVESSIDHIRNMVKEGKIK